MFSRREYSHIDQALAAKLLLFKQQFVIHNPNFKGYHRFLLDVLQDIVNEVSQISPSLFAMESYQMHRLSRLVLGPVSGNERQTGVNLLEEISQYLEDNRNSY